MTKLICVTRALCTAVVVMSLLAAGCGTNSSSTQQSGSSGAVSIDPKVLLAGVSTGLLQPAARSLGGWEWGSFINSFGSLLTSINFNNTLEMQKVTYQSTGADGQPHSMTGLLILPKSFSGA